MTTIVHIITGLETGGAERSLFNLLKGGLNDMFENHVISLTTEGSFGARITALGIEVHALGMRRGLPGPAGYLKLRRTVRKLRPDILQGWMYHGNLAAFYSSSVGSKPRLFWNIRVGLDNFASWKRTTRWTVRAGARRSPLPEAVIFNSSRAKQQHQTIGYSASNGVHIPNGFDTTLFRPRPDEREALRARLGISGDGAVIGYVGRNHANKALPDLFDALFLALQKNASARVVFAGQGLQNALPQNHKLRKFGDRTQFLGNRADIEDILPALDVLCLSSENEGFPNVIGEAMACGVPCVATDVGDCHELIANSGYVVPATQPETLGHALSRLLGQPESERKNLGALARERIEQEYSLEKCVARYVELYSNPVKRPGTCAE